MTTTNVMRMLDKLKVTYSAREYDYDESDLSGVHAAEALGLPQEEVFKTLVGQGDKTGYCVFVIPVAEELDLKKCAAASGNKRVELIHVKELLPLTGYIRGGCSPIGMKKKFPTFIDETCQLVENISVSAGQRGLQVYLSPEDLIKVSEAVVSDLIKL